VASHGVETVEKRLNHYARLPIFRSGVTKTTKGSRVRNARPTGGDIVAKNDVLSSGLGFTVIELLVSLILFSIGLGLTSAVFTA
jgi:prepilin-type N-terminal cleavage/methylation domain-containing protein